MSPLQEVCASNNRLLPDDELNLDRVIGFTLRSNVLNVPVEPEVKEAEDSLASREDRKVSFEEGSKLAEEFKMKYYETSAETNYNVNETFTYLTKDILSNLETYKAIAVETNENSKHGNCLVI